MSASSELELSAKRLADCEQALEYRFSDRTLLTRCLTHSSVARTRLDSNERLEFLGDAILGAVVCEMLYHRFPELPEGELTRMKSTLVSRHMCARITDRLGLAESLFLGKGLAIHDEVPMSILAAVFESLIAGVYLDGGSEASRELIERLIAPEMELVAQSGNRRNFKSLLQQLSQKHTGETPEYRLLDEKGPDHSKCFEIAAVIGSRVFSAAWGASKKEAQQHAARNALAELQQSLLEEGDAAFDQPESSGALSPGNSPNSPDR